jgi:hypothetical protein
VIVMQDQAWVLTLIETAQRATPSCATCYAPTTPVARDGDLWIECSSIQRERPFLRRLLSLDLPSRHTRRLLLEDAA